MIDAKLSLAHVEPVETKRLAPLLGLGLAAAGSLGLWSLLVLAVEHLF